MKKLSLSIITILAILITSCTGDPGPQGPPGVDGVTIVGQSFERTVDFLPSNNYEQYIQIPTSIELFPTDMTLVYILWELDPVTGNDVWRLIPQTVFTDSGEVFQYNYDYSFDEVRLFIDAPVNFDFNSLSTAATLNQTFRVVVLPVDFVNSRNLNVNDYNEIKNYIQ